MIPAPQAFPPGFIPRFTRQRQEVINGSMKDSGHTFDAYFKRATSPLVVLRLLRDRPMYGYEISQAMKEKSGGRFTIAVLYPVLYRLEEQGYIHIDHTEVIQNRARSYYAITPAGEAYLLKSLAEYYEIQDAFLSIMAEEE